MQASSGMTPSWDGIAVSAVTHGGQWPSHPTFTQHTAAFQILPAIPASSALRDSLVGRGSETLGTELRFSAGWRGDSSNPSSPLAPCMPQRLCPCLKLLGGAGQLQDPPGPQGPPRPSRPPRPPRPLQTPQAQVNSTLTRQQPCNPPPQALSATLWTEASRASGPPF
jgi:hypothetical protein